MKVFKEIFWQFQLLLKRFRLGFIQNVRIEIHKQTPSLSTAPAVSHDKCRPSAASAPHSIPAHITKLVVIWGLELWKYHTKQFFERLG